jgi:hypothetical protein
MFRVQFPLEPFNTLVREGTIGETVQRLMASTKPEAAYFVEIDGGRGAVMIVNLDKASDVPKIAEPWMLTLNAKINFSICMTPDDLGKAGLSELGKQWS